ncbi:Cyanovirin-N [Laetiporus sulphureus 93-53]|uniref:Cyanovirin-N n=1 Tax=Laetiporus sulphureus 93-53 TaxID=1314785 RepID=A0A165ELR7_9APHY|nr:Cyanovirin-N [Laetiporus sulphureus 93-53]KZT07321.1 Cyanovirin-N [Laetiporus sulphureus 93-53]
MKLNILALVGIATFVSAIPAEDIALNITGGPVPDHGGGFSGTCSSWGGSYSQHVAELQATCYDDHGAQDTTSLDLNNCIENHNGNLGCAWNGHFLGSCNVENSLGTGNTVLSVSCADGRGGMVSRSIDVNDCVSNSNGGLSCH